MSPKAVPALADAAEVFGGIRRRPGTVYVALVPNPKGAERALAAKVDEINLVASVSETHNRANMGMSPADSIAGFARIMDTVQGDASQHQRHGGHRLRLPVRGRPAGRPRCWLRWSATCRWASTG